MIDHSRRHGARLRHRGPSVCRTICRSAARSRSPAKWANSRRSISLSIPHKRYTFWSGIIGGFFLALSYFGADQSQVQRYLAGGSLRASRFGLLFNAIVKVPMQFLILLLGAMVFLFYQFEKPPMFFNQPAYQRAMACGFGPQLQHAADEVRRRFHAETGRDPQLAPPSAQLASNWMRTMRSTASATRPRKFSNRPARVRRARTRTMFSSPLFCNHLPHGVVGLLVAVILCATMSATAGALNALGSTTVVDFYRPLLRPNASDHHYVVATQVSHRGLGTDRDRRRVLRQPGREPD